MARHLELYNVGWVLCWSPRARRYFEAYAEASRIDDFDRFTLYRIHREPSWFVRGSGRVHAVPNRIELSDLTADQGTVILKYHWLETLRSEPPRELRPVSLLGDPVPFISVIDPPRSLLIYNAPGFWRGDSASLHRVAGNRSSPALRATNQQ